MNRTSIVCTILLVALASPSVAEPDNPDKYLNAVREFADNVLKYGGDRTRFLFMKQTEV